MTCDQVYIQIYWYTVSFEMEGDTDRNNDDINTLADDISVDEDFQVASRMSGGTEVKSTSQDVAVTTNTNYVPGMANESVIRDVARRLRQIGDEFDREHSNTNIMPAFRELFVGHVFQEFHRKFEIVIRIFRPI